MVKIILSRVGKKNHPLFRVIVLDKQKDPWGNALEIVGNLNPHTKQTTLDAERIKYWISKGAQPSATVHNLLIEQKIIEAKKTRVSTLSKKRKEKLAEKAKAKAEKVAAAKLAAEEAAKAEAEAKAAAEATPEAPAEETAAETTE